MGILGRQSRKAARGSQHFRKSRKWVLAGNRFGLGSGWVNV